MSRVLSTTAAGAMVALVAMVGMTAPSYAATKKASAHHKKMAHRGRAPARVAAAPNRTGYQPYANGDDGSPFGGLFGSGGFFDSGPILANGKPRPVTAYNGGPYGGGQYGAGYGGGGLLGGGGVLGTGVGGGNGVLGTGVLDGQGALGLGVLGL